MCRRQNVRSLPRATRDPRKTEGEPLDSGFQRSTGATSRAQVPEPGDTRRVVPPRRGVATVSTAESALCNCSAAGGRGVGGGGAIQRRPVIGCWGGARRRGGAGPASDLRALAGGAARDTWCGTGAVSRRSPCGPSFPGGSCGLGTGWGWAGHRTGRCGSHPGLRSSCGTRGIQVRAAGGPRSLMHCQPRPESPQAPARARVLEELSPGPRPPSRKSRF